MISVRNIKKGFTSGIYVGRDMPGWTGSVLANRFRAEEHGRLVAIDLYRAWLAKMILQEDEVVMAELRRIRAQADAGDVDLLCWCEPYVCHSEVIRAAVETLHCISVSSSR
jgi:hypothetical protein